MIKYSLRTGEKRQKCKPIKCPSCNHGRLCDAPIASESLATNDTMGEDADKIILKCPKCGLSIDLTIE